MPALVETHAKFIGLKACQNPDYATLNFAVPEFYRGITIPSEQFSEPNCRILVKSAEVGNFGLQPNSSYRLQLAISVKPQRDKYPASINFELVKAVPK